MHDMGMLHDLDAPVTSTQNSKLLNNFTAWRFYLGGRGHDKIDPRKTMIWMQWTNNTLNTTDKIQSKMWMDSMAFASSSK